MANLLITRPLAEAQALAAQLEPQGFTCHIQPMFSVVLNPHAVAQLEAITTPQAIILTSQQALPANIPSHLLAMPVLTVGSATAQAAKDAGFTHVTATGQCVDDLCAHIRQHLIVSDGSLLYLRGEHITRDLSAALPDYSINEVTTYHTPALAWESKTLALLQQPTLDSVLFFSARSAALFMEGIAQHQRTDALSAMTAFCLSATIAQPLNPSQWQRILTAPEPTQASLITLLSTHP